MRRIAFSIVALACLAACRDSTGTGTQATPVAHIRIVNSLYQGASATAAPVSIDYLIDGSTAAPGVANLGANAIGAGPTSNNYQDVSVGVHSFMARIAGKSTQTDSLYTTSTNLPWVPRQYITANGYYTIVVGGLIPASGQIPNNAVPFSAVVDDPFPPIKINGTYQARFRVINAAPFAAASGNGSAVQIFITPGNTPPTPITSVSNLGIAQYRNASPYLNVDAGTYVLTLATLAAVPLSQTVVTFTAGEVRTFIIQSSGPAPAPGVANHKLTSIVDQTY